MGELKVLDEMISEIHESKLSIEEKVLAWGILLCAKLRISKEELDPYASKWLYWIDVKFLKPELWVRVLCFEDLGNWNWVQYVARLEEWWFYKNHTYVEYPTHWMPLPNNP